MSNTPQQEAPELPKKASFFSSVVSGITGFVKGALAGGVVGALGGALIGALAAGIGILTLPVLPATFAIGAGIVGAGALMGTTIGAAATATVGAAAGTMTGVVRSREAGQPTAEDVVNVAKISFAQGVAVGHNIEQATAAQQTQHAAKITAERASAATAERQVIN